MRRIVFAYDQAMDARNGLAHTLYLGKQLKVPVCVFYAYEFQEDFNSREHDELMDLKAEEIQSEVTAIIDELRTFRTEFSGLTSKAFDLQIVQGNYFNELKWELLQADTMLCILEVSANKLQKRLSEEQIRDLMSEVTTPLLLVPEEHLFISFERAVFPISPNFGADVALLPGLSRFLKRFGIEIESYQSQLEGGEQVDHLENYIERKGIDLVVYLKKQRGCGPYFQRQSDGENQLILTRTYSDCQSKILGRDFDSRAGCGLTFWDFSRERVFCVA